MINVQKTPLLKGTYMEGLDVYIYVINTYIYIHVYKYSQPRTNTQWINN